MAKINVRSPYYVSRTEISLTQVDMDLWIYTGEQVNDRNGQNGTLFRLTSFAVAEVATFEISEIIKDYIDNQFQGEYDSFNVWVDFRTNNYVSGIAQGFTSFTLLRGFYGYGYFQDGANPALQSDYLQSNLTILKYAGESLMIPVDTECTTSVSFYNEGDLVNNQIVSSSILSNSQIQYITNTGSTFNNFRQRVEDDGGTFEDNICLEQFQQEFDNFPVDTIFINGCDGVTVIEVKDIEECKYTPYKVTFENRFGALQDLWFFKRSNKKLTTKKETFKRNIIVNGTYNVSSHQQKVLTKNGVEKMTLNTGFYPELYNDIFKELQLSENVWIEIENRITPVNVDSSGLEYKTQLNEKLINYTVDLSFAFDTINNIR